MNEEGLARLLRRNNELLEVLVRLQLHAVLEVELSDPVESRLYELTGDKPIAKIASELRISAGKISGIWKRWERQGLLVKDGRSYRRIV